MIPPSNSGSNGGAEGFNGLPLLAEASLGLASALALMYLSERGSRLHNLGRALTPGAVSLVLSTAFDAMKHPDGLSPGITQMLNRWFTEPRNPDSDRQQSPLPETFYS